MYFAKIQNDWITEKPVMAKQSSTRLDIKLSFIGALLTATTMNTPLTSTNIIMTASDLFNITSD